MYRNRCFVFCFVFCFVCEITRESEKCNLMEDCTIAISGGRNFVMVLIKFNDWFGTGNQAQCANIATSFNFQDP